MEAEQSNDIKGESKREERHRDGKTWIVPPSRASKTSGGVDVAPGEG